MTIERSKFGRSIGWGTLIQPGSIDLDHPDDFCFGLLGDSDDHWTVSSISSFSIGFDGVIDYRSSIGLKMLSTGKSFSIDGGSGVIDGTIEESSPSSSWLLTIWVSSSINFSGWSSFKSSSLISFSSPCSILISKSFVNSTGVWT